MNVRKIIESIEQGGNLNRAEAIKLLAVEDAQEYSNLIEASHQLMVAKKRAQADLCALINAKSGACSEDCHFCAQSSHFRVDIKEYPLVSKEEILKKAQAAEQMGAHRFCIVTSGGRLSEKEFSYVLDAFRLLRQETTLGLDGSLGFVTDNEIIALKKVGVTRFNHNLETSERFFPNICTTHTYQDRFETLKKLKKHGMQICSGGIIGLGETHEDRVDLACALRELEVTCVPINILNPRPGTPLADVPKIFYKDIIKTVAVFRLLLPKATIKIAGGREVNLGEHQQEALYAGANGIIIGGYLTTVGNQATDDIKIVKAAGLMI